MTIVMRKRSDLERILDKNEIKHDRKVSNISEQLRGYGYDIDTHIEYYDNVTNKVVGEVDILAKDKYGYMNVEVKCNGRGMVKGYEQLRRFKHYFPNLNVVNSLFINKNGVYRVD